MELRSRQQALAQGETRYYTGKPCVRGHLSWRATVNGTCAECRGLRNGEARAAYSQRYYETNAAKLREYSKQYYKLNTDKVKAGIKKWQIENSEYFRALNKGHRARKINAQPPWVDREHLKRIAAVYAKADGGHVDHCVPLQGKTVCGLHVWWNLRVLSPAENMSRKRVWDPFSQEASILGRYHG
jgi:hypothetical protein